MSIVLDETSCTINDEAVEILEMYYQIATSNFKRIAVKHIFYQIYQADNTIKDSIRADYFFIYRFLLKTLVETKLSGENQSFIDEIEKLIIDTLVALIVPALPERSKVYWYLLKLEAIMTTVYK